MYEPDDELERELREGLRLREAPIGFADRVAAMAAGQSARRRVPFAALVQTPIMRLAVAASLLIAVAAGAWSHYDREQRIAGEHAREQVLLALRITSSTLQAVHNKVTNEDE